MGYSGNGGQFALRRSCRQLGSSAFLPSESGSLFGLRRSLRLRSKPAVTMSMKQSRKRRNSRNLKPKRLRFWAQPGEIIIRGGYFAMPRILREQRSGATIRFRNAYNDSWTTSDQWDYIVEKRFIVASGREHAFPDAGRSHGIMWIGVHGIDSICAVFLSKEPDMQCIIDSLGDKFLTDFMKYVLSEMEDIADTPPYSDVVGEKPFAVVSFPDYHVDEQSCQKAPAPSVEAARKAVEYLTPSIQAQGKAVQYLETKMSNHSEFSMRQSQVIAISAFQHLCQRKLHAKEFMVCYFYELDNDYEMEMLSTSEKKELLSRLESEEGEHSSVAPSLQGGVPVDVSAVLPEALGKSE